MKLAPFSPYMSKPTPQSRQAISSQIMNPSDEMTDQIIKGLVEILAIEGPTLSTRAFTQYGRKGGIVKMTRVAVQRFTKALVKAKKDGKILFEIDPCEEGVAYLLWLPTQERVSVREYGNRGFEDIPASELGELMFTLADEMHDASDKTKLYTKITELYGLKQLPKNATARLDFVYQQYLA
jgi:hypothetical protein